MQTIHDRILSWGLKHGSTDSLPRVLRLLLEERKTIKKMASMFSCSTQSIRNKMIDCRIIRPKKRFMAKLTSMGYRSLAEFFTDPVNVRRSLAKIARVSGFSYVTVSKKYSEFLKDRV